MKIQKLNEPNKFRRLKRSLFGDPTGKIKTFAAISPQNPLGWENSTEEEFKKRFVEYTKNKQKYNADKLKELKAEFVKDRIEQTGNEALKYGHFNYVPVTGSFGEVEKTLIIFNLTIGDAKIIARDYGQLSFFFGKVSNDEGQASTIAYYKTFDNCNSYKLVEISRTITDETDAEDFFSKFGFKYRINMREFGDDVDSIKNDGYFEESMNENLTFSARASYRRMAYGEDDGII